MEYAKETSVSPEKSKAEIETAVRRFGASAFVSGWDKNAAFVQFKIHDRFVRFDLALPAGTESRFQERKVRGWMESTTPEWRAQAVEQEIRSRWRALLLSIKARLSAVEAGIETFEEAFLPYVLLPGGSTVATTVLPLVTRAYETGRMPAGLALAAPAASVEGEAQEPDGTDEG